MTSKKWKIQIINNCESVGTYKDSFIEPINTLASILEQRDKTFKLYKQTGGNPVVNHVNKAKQSNPVKNPYLVTWEELNAQALNYWRDLGLTPAGLKKINEDALKKKKTSSFAELLKDELTKK